jgi:hypothetical protein
MSSQKLLMIGVMLFANLGNVVSGILSPNRGLGMSMIRRLSLPMLFLERRCLRGSNRGSHSGEWSVRAAVNRGCVLNNHSSGSHVEGDAWTWLPVLN